MADIESNVKVNIDTSDALAQLKLLQQQISAFQQAMRKAGADNALAARQMQQNLVNSINATGKFQANIQTIQTSAERFTTALEKNKLTMGEYFRYAGGASKTFGKLFKSEFDTINQVARERVKDLQTQYIKLGRDANGAMKAISVRPLALDMDNLGTKTQLAAQRQALFNQLMKQGSTQLLNFGKNTQWAGRQLMVGFTVPLTMMGSAAAKAYMEIEKASISFKRVYGDINTTADETERMARSVKALANEFTKYGVAVSDTMDMAAKAAAMGKTGADLLAQISQANKLAVLGNVDQNQALETTISLTNAFGTSADQLSGKIDFLNAVENQTVTSIEDLTIAIPKAAPVVKQLGGNVEDLAFFLTAMKEGGINASEGANALKSGIASMINPTKKASDFLAGFGINVKGIVEADKGNIKKTVIDMAKAFDTLDPLNRARAIEQMFGKFQFARISTLFQNVIKEGSQAQTVAGLASQTAEELSVLSEREMKKISDSPMYKFQKSIQDIQAKLAPVGEAFLKAVTPIIDFVGKVLDGFNNLGEGSKQFITILVTAVAGIGPLLLMTFGLVANGIANIMKLFTNMKSFINKTTRPSDILGEQTSYMNTEQLRAAAIAASLDQAHAKLRQTFTSEKQAVDELTTAYRNAVTAQQAFSGVPGVPVGNPNATPKKYANGVSMVPGPAGAGDIVPALLSPGEAVIPAKHARKYAPVIAGMVAGNLPGFESGTTGAGMTQSVYGPLTQKQTEGLARTGMQLKDISDEVMAGPYANVPPTDFGTQISPTTGHSFPAFNVGGIYEKPDGTRVFVKPQMDLTSALAEVRGTEIARSAHGLVAPQQKIAVMMDPTDPDKKRRFIVLESPLDSRIADIPNTFTKDQYFTQLVASLLRGDKDLGLGNLGGNVLADVGPAGVFGRASGKRALGSAINSMEEQAIINLLGVKGGAKRFFAEATSEMVSKMTPGEYDAAMKAEIQRVIPKLDATIAGFGPMSPEETVAYQAMQQRLRAGLGVDWGKYQVMHSAVKPKMFAGGTAGVGLSKAILAQESHLQGAMDPNDPEVLKQLQRVYGPNVKPQDFANFEILGNLTMTLPGTINQRLKSGGMQSRDFLVAYNALSGKLSKTALRAGVKDMAASQELENMIGIEAAKSAVVTDPSLAIASRNALSNASIMPGPLGAAAIMIMERMKQVGTVRSKFDAGEGNQEEILLGMLRRGEAKFNSGRQIVMSNFDARVGRFNFDPFGSGKPTASPEELALRAEAQKAADAWISAGNWSAPLPMLKNSKGKLTKLSLRSNSGKPGEFGPPLGNIAYDQNKKGYEGNLSLVEGGAEALRTILGLAMPGFAKGTANVGATGKPKASIFDIDDTLLNLSAFMPAHQAANEKLPKEQRKDWYKEVAKNPQPIPAGIAALKAAQARGNKIILMTARPESYDVHTRETLAKLGIDMKGIKLIARKDKDYRKPEQMKYEITKAYQQWYDIEEFYDDMDKTRGAISLLGIQTHNPLKLANGLFSVPGPKGAGDVVPAMLSPGEAVIPADKAEKHRGMIAQMISGSLPGYAEGTAGVPGYAKGSKKVSKGKSASSSSEVTVLTLDQIQEQLAAEDADYALLLERKKQLEMKYVLTAKEKKELEQNKANIVKREEQFKSEKNVKEKGQGVGKLFTRTAATGKIQGLAYGATAVASAASMIPGPIGQAAQAAMPAIGAFTSAMSMIPGPAGIAVGALMAVVTVWNQVNEALTKMRNESFQLASALGSGNGAIQKFAEFAKTVSGTESMNKRREDSAGQFFNVVQGKTTFGESYMKSDAGKQLVKDVGESVKAGGFTQAKTLITQQLSTAIAAGVMTTAQARSIAANLGKQLKSTDFALSVSAKLTETFGPNGENLKENPLKVRIGIAKESGQIFKKFTEDVTEAGTAGFGTAEKQGGAIAANLQSTLDVQQQMVDSLQIDYEKRIAIARAAGDTAEATRLQTQYLREQKELLDANALTGQQIFDQLNSLDPGLLGQAKEAAYTSIETAYKGTGQESFATIAQDRIKNKMVGTDAQKTQLATAVASKQIGFQQLETAQNLFGGTEEGMNDLSKMITEKGGIEVNRALGLTSMMGDKAKKKFMLDFGLADPQKAKEMNDALELAQKTVGPFGDDEVTKKAIVDFNVKNSDDVIKAKKNIDALQGLSGNKITLAVTTGSLFSKDVQGAIKKDIKRFNKYNDAGKITYTTELQQIMRMSGDKDMINAFKVWRKEQGDSTLTFADFASYQADRTVKAQGIDNTKGPGSAEDQNKQAAAPEPSILDPYVKMLREANNWQQKLTTGWNDSYKAIMKYTSASIKQMGGFAVLMQEQGAAAEEIQAFMNGTEAEQNRIIDKKTGKLKKDAGELLKKLKEIREASEIGLKYVLMTPAERLAKDNELYQAGLDVIALKEKEVNDKYDKRVKALDEISKLQERNNQKQQDALTLADALSKGDIAAAARAALQAKQNDQKAALDDAKTSMENARKKELEGIEVRINGVLTDRTKLEETMAKNAKDIADAKLLEAQRQADIQQNALKSAKHMAQLLKDGKALSLLKPYNPGVPGKLPTSDQKDDKKSNIGKVGYDSKGNAVANPYAAGKGMLGQSGVDIAWDFKNKKWTTTARDVNKGKEGYVQDEKTPGKWIPVGQSGKKMGQYQYATRQEAAKTAKSGEKVEWVYDDATNTGYFQTAMAKLGTKENPNQIIDAVSGSSFDKPSNALLESKSYYKFPKGAWIYGVIKDGNKYRVSYGLRDPGYGPAGKNLQTTGRTILAEDKLAQLGTTAINYQYYNDMNKTYDWTTGFFPIAQFARGGMVYANNGLNVEASKYALGTDTIPAMLTPGEFVMSKPAVDRIGTDSLSSMNNGTSIGESVYNYSITVNANSSDAQGIADAVLREIKRVDSQRIRSSVI